jgi:hypothetical protein
MELLMFSRIAVSVLIALTAAPAFAFEYGRVDMTCNQARTMANNTGYITVEGQIGVFDLAVIGLEGITVPFGSHVFVSATDNKHCLVGYIADDFEHGK